MKGRRTAHREHGQTQKPSLRSKDSNHASWAMTKLEDFCSGFFFSDTIRTKDEGQSQAKKLLGTKRDLIKIINRTLNCFVGKK